MNLREAAQQALDAMELHLQWHESGCVYLEPAVTSIRAALAEDAMQRLTDVQQEMDCYGDGNVYRGQRSSDSKTPTLTINGMPAVEGPLSKAHRTCQESRQVEPVAYVTGFSKGYATVRPVDPCLLMCVGMALYRSPPTISKTETVEPVAWIGCLEGGIEYGTYHKAALKLPDGVRFDLYTAPPKRKPISTDMILATWVEECIPKRGTPELVVAFARAIIERAHGIGGDE